MTYWTVNTIFVLVVYNTIMIFISLKASAETPLNAISAAGVVIAIITAIYLNKIADIKAKNKVEFDKTEYIADHKRLIMTELSSLAENVCQYRIRLLNNIDSKKRVYSLYPFNDSRMFFDTISNDFGKFPKKLQEIIIKEERLLRSYLKQEVVVDDSTDKEVAISTINLFEDIIGRCAIYITKIETEDNSTDIDKYIEVLNKIGIPDAQGLMKRFKSRALNLASTKKEDDGAPPQTPG